MREAPSARTRAVFQLSRVRRIVQILCLVAVGCEAPGQEAELIYQSPLRYGFGFTADFLVVPAVIRARFTVGLADFRWGSLARSS